MNFLQMNVVVKKEAVERNPANLVSLLTHTMQVGLTKRGRVMICKPCSVAGDMVQIFRNTCVILPKSKVLDVAYAYHTLCKGRSHCDCQHFIDFEGKAIQSA